MKLTVEEIAEAVEGQIILPASADGLRLEAAQPSLRPSASATLVSGMTWDSRTVQVGDLYVCLPGERVDGHDFAAAAVAAGAVAVLASREVSVEAPVIYVGDTNHALWDLAAYWRGRLKGRVIGLTGSSGKTTTKGLIRDVLSVAGTVVATKANQNNELGTCNTLLAADEDTDFIVLEMGSRGAGHIKTLCDIAHPDWGVITNIGESHLELFKSRENIARAKAELFEGLPQGGMAFVNADDDFAEALCDLGKLDERGVSIVSFSGNESSLGAAARSVYATGVVLDADSRPTFTLHAADAACECLLELRGLHNVGNACAAAAVGLAAGLTLPECCAALAKSQPEAGRQRILQAKAGITVVDDAYNANPDSMRVSLKMFAALDVPGRHIAVLGDMGELGVFARECHERVGTIAGQVGLDALICVGELSEHIALAAVDAGMADTAVRHTSTVDAALIELKSLVEPGDAVLVKASHFMEFDRIVEGLVD